MATTTQNPPPSTHSAAIEGQFHLESRRNVGSSERAVSAVGGGLLTLYGLTRFSLGGLALSAVGGALLYRGLSGQSIVYKELGINSANGRRSVNPVRIEESVVIAKPREEVYAFWRNVENLPQFMHHLESVRRKDDKHSHWTMRVPKGAGKVAWDAEITHDQPNEKLAWRSFPHADVTNAGNVRFKELKDKGTAVHVTIEYRPPAGGLGDAAAKVLNPILSQMIKEDVRRFKRLMETGELPTTEGQPSGPH